MGNTFGHTFRITTWGESHGGAVGVVIDGCPPGLEITPEEIQRELDRRRPGQSSVTTSRQEEDRAQVLSGVFEGHTLGTPICIMVWNKDARPEAYADLQSVYRPSHADYTYQAKYGIRDWRGGGRASARETVGRVAAGALARKLLKVAAGTEIVAYVRQVHTIFADVDPEGVTLEQVESTMVRCPDVQAAEEMVERIERARKEGDSLGGVVECVARGAPPGWGEPVFDKLDADLAKAMLSIPAAKGVEIGSGFSGAAMKGSEHNDPFVSEGGRIRTRTNHSGGIQGGISNGETIFLRVAFKPTATIRKEQETVDARSRPTVLAAQGRHDPCVLPRAVPVVEAMTALVLADHFLRHRGQCGG